VACAALAGTLVLAGCETDGIDIPARALKPLSPAMLSELDSKNMAKESPVVVRLFKEESELEVWKEDRTGHFALLRTYPICRWSGELGPKTREGDRQAPEGFYTITQAQMNPNSHYYLSFDIGYPNAFDRAYGRTGSNLMVHGDCSSRGCYAMTDDQIGEIYALARESFFGGQRSFQVQAYPFRMTALNMARHRDNPHMAFWKMLKEGNDHFLVSGLEPKVDVCEKRYVFDAEAPAGGSATSLHFDPAGHCPAYKVREDIATAVKEKAHQDDVETAEFVSRGIRTVPVRTGTDGGTNAAFLSTYQPQTVREADGTIHTVVTKRPPSLFPLHLDLPGNGDTAPTPVPVAAVATIPAAKPAPAPSPAPTPPTSKQAAVHTPAAHAAANPAVAPATSGADAAPAEQAVKNDSRSEGGNLFTRLFRAVGHEDQKVEAAPDSTASISRSESKPGVAAKSRPKTEPKPHLGHQDGVPPQQVQAFAPQTPAQPGLAPTQASSATGDAGGNLISGAQPVMPSGGFEGRWSGLH
jgi:murein L,D-transpeptidase YafK